MELDKNINRILKETVCILQQKGSILYPTETVWGIGCDATSKEAVQKVYDIKARSQEKSLIVLVSDYTMLKKYVTDLSPLTLDLIQSFSKPLTIIYSNAKGFADNVYHKDGSVGIRVIQQPFCQQLISSFGNPIVSTSANISGQPTPLSFQSISSDILNRVDYVVNLPSFTGSGIPSTIAKVNDDGELIIVRP